LFGAGLFLGGLAEPDKIVGTLRLKDFHAMRTIAVFILVGMLGVWILDLAGVVHLSVKPDTFLTVVIGGGLLGIGFGLTGYCPGTGLACAITGRIDALITVLGMFAGAFVFILLYPEFIKPIEAIGDYGKKSLFEITNTTRTAWTIPIVVVGAIVLFLTRPKKKTV
jgi:hypothetical protein